VALEQQRGITIKSAVVSFAIDDVTVNLIDPPGHPDFIAEVERVLQRQLPALTGGEGVLESSFAGYQPVSGDQPTRRRTAAMTWLCKP
jgi:predicted membrane GTPase involved in stress response